MESLEIRYPIHELLRLRWSPLAFSTKAVEPDKLLSLFEAARWAPSSYNEQPWSFVVATRENMAEFQKLLDCLVEGNAVWAQNAPVLMLSVAKLNFTRDGLPNRHAFHDVGLAVANLIFQATALGLSVHQMAGFDMEKARETLKLPSGYEPVGCIAVGYGDVVETLPERLQKRHQSSRARKRLEEFVFANKWGHVSALIGAQMGERPEPDLGRGPIAGVSGPGSKRLAEIG